MSETIEAGERKTSCSDCEVLGTLADCDAYACYDKEDREGWVEAFEARAGSIVDYSMRKGIEMLFVAAEHYPMEWEVMGDFLTGLWTIRGSYTKENPPYCQRLMDKPFLGKYNRVDAIERVLGLLKLGAILV